MAASGAPARQPRRGPAPIASFDHDGSDESSPETKQTFRLPEIREDPAGAAHPEKAIADGANGSCLLPPEQRARSHSTPNASLHTPAAPRIDISRASSSSHHDSRDSSPELALFAGAVGNGEEARTRLELGFREDGALDLRSSTEELAFLEGAPGEPRPPPPAPSRRHSRKDSQSSEAALLAVSGRTSRLSSVGSQCSAHSVLSGFSHVSHISRLSVVSGVSRSPSPHKMLLETSFCGPKPIETDPEVCAAAVEEHLLEIAKKSSLQSQPAPPPGDARDRREVRTEVTVESIPSSTTPSAWTPPTLPTSNTTVVPTAAVVNGDKQLKETQNRARVEERRARPKVTRQPSEPEVYKSSNRTKDIIRIKLKPDEDYEDEDDEDKRTVVPDVDQSPARKPVTLELEAVGVRTARPTQPPTSPGPAPPSAPPTSRDSRSPSPAGPPVSRKSSFCSLFKSREMIASPDSPSEALRRKRSLTEGRSRSKSRDRSATPTSTSKMRGSVLSLFRTPKRAPPSPSPSSREGSPVVHAQRPLTTPVPAESARHGEKLKYYEDTRDGIIHIPLRTPPDERPASSELRGDSGSRVTVAEIVTHREPPRPASAPATRQLTESSRIRDETRTASKPPTRTVLPDGSIIIPLRSPTESDPDTTFEESVEAQSNVLVTDKKEGHDNGAPIGDNVQTNPSGPPEGRDAADGAEASPDHELRESGAPARTTADALKDGEDGRSRRKERLVFSTHVGSREQVFSTQFSITKTPSVTSEMSGSFPSFIENEEPRTVRPRDLPTTASDRKPEANEAASAVPSPQEPPRDSSESEPSSEAAPSHTGNEVEKRGLVVQESFEDELPYVPTTLPLERSVALPMVPVRERGGVCVAGLERPRALPGGAVGSRMPRPPPASPVPPASSPDKLRIKLPRRVRPSSESATTSRASRSRTRSGGDGAEARPKPEWIDFEEVPERRKQPKRIQTLPAGAAPPAAVLFNYVEPERCRCECHAHSRAEDADATLASTRLNSTLADGEPPMAQGASPPRTPRLRPFVADFDSRPDSEASEAGAGRR